MAYSEQLENEILKKCYSNYLRTNIPKAEITFGFESEIRTDYFDTLNRMYSNGLIKPNYLAIGMCFPVLTERGIRYCESIF